MKTIEELHEAVLHEATALRQHATPEEINRLNILDLDPGLTTQCIYGQMTGHCGTPRAKELMSQCCKRVFDYNFSPPSYDEKEALAALNGEFQGQGWLEETTKFYNGQRIHIRNWSYLSAIEGYILLSNSNQKGLIAYIKGETDTLKL